MFLVSPRVEKPAPNFPGIKCGVAPGPWWTKLWGNIASTGCLELALDVPSTVLHNSLRDRGRPALEWLCRLKYSCRNAQSDWRGEWPASTTAVVNAENWNSG